MSRDEYDPQVDIAVQLERIADALETIAGKMPSNAVDYGRLADAQLRAAVQAGAVR